MARLKVFRADLGFFETIVAAPSQKAALAAWGVNQDLFKEGAAKVTTDPAAVDAASAQPGVVLRRGAGTSDPFRPESEPPTSLPKPPDLPKPPKPPPAKGSPPKPKPPPDRSKLTAAEKALADREGRFDEDLESLAERRRELDAREAELRARMDKDRTALQAAVDRARTAYTRAGGKVISAPG